MKRLLIIFLSVLTLSGSVSNKQVEFQQPDKNFDYNSSWDKVTEFENQGLPKSAMEKVNEIYEFAKKENNAQQLVKAVIFTLRLTDYKEEDALIKNLNRLKNEAKTAVFPAKPGLPAT